MNFMRIQIVGKNFSSKQEKRIEEASLPPQTSLNVIASITAVLSCLKRQQQSIFTQNMPQEKF